MLNQLLTESKKWFHAIMYETNENCILCEGNEGPVCSECIKGYFHPELGRCSTCGKLIEPTARSCSDCLLGKGPQYLTGVTAIGHYAGAWQEFIQRAKFRSQPFLYEKIGRTLTNWAIQHLPFPDLVAAVPMHPERLMERGFNQAEVLASIVHWQLGVPMLEGLVRIKPTPAQVSLTRQERLHNLAGAFGFSGSRKIYTTRVWLVDDVITTGATLDECAGILRNQGYSEVFGISLAAGMEKSLVSQMK